MVSLPRRIFLCRSSRPASPICCSQEPEPKNFLHSSARLISSIIRSCAAYGISNVYWCDPSFPHPTARFGLFVQSARRVRSDFSLSADRESVLRICRPGRRDAAGVRNYCWRGSDAYLPRNRAIWNAACDILESMRGMCLSAPQHSAVIRAFLNLLTEARAGCPLPALSLSSAVSTGSSRSGERCFAWLGSRRSVDKSLLVYDARDATILHELLRHMSKKI